MIYKLAQAAEKSWYRLRGLNLLPKVILCKVQRGNRGHQIASSSRCRLTPVITKIQR